MFHGAKDWRFSRYSRSKMAHSLAYSFAYLIILEHTANLRLLSIAPRGNLKMITFRLPLLWIKLMLNTIRVPVGVYANEEPPNQFDCQFWSGLNGDHCNSVVVELAGDRVDQLIGDRFVAEDTDLHFHCDRHFSIDSQSNELRDSVFWLWSWIC